MSPSHVPQSGASLSRGAVYRRTVLALIVCSACSTESPPTSQPTPTPPDCLDAAVGALPARSPQTRLRLEAGDLALALRGNKEAANGGFNGLVDIKLKGQELNWLGPLWNFEHVFDGAHHQPGVDLSIADIFEPRLERAVTTLHRLSNDTVTLPGFHGPLR